MASWGVVATVRAPLSLCTQFAAHYLSIGAEAVYLYHDDPFLVSFVDRHGVHNIVCNDAYWRGSRPDDLETRQRLNATQAKLATDVDWIMHCDIDELCYSERPIGDVLDDQEGQTAGVMVSSLEAVYNSPPAQSSVFATPYFKAFFDRNGVHKAYSKQSADFYGDIWSASKSGFWSHVQGKSFIRAAVDIGKMPLHHKGLREDGWNMRIPTNEIVLRHYEATSFELWKDKHVRRITGDVHVPNAGRFRAAQQALISKAWDENGEEGLRSLYIRMACLSEQQLSDGIKSGFIRVIPPEPHLVSVACALSS